MKTPAVILLSVLIFAGCSASSHYSSLSKQETQARVERDLSSRQIVIDVNRALPMQGRSITLSGSYGLKIVGDSVYSYLPYYGRAYSAPYGGGEGMIFEGLATDYRVGTGKKDETNIMFSVRTREDYYTFNVSLWPNGSASITAKPNNKQQITYTGQMRLEP